MSGTSNDRQPKPGTPAGWYPYPEMERTQRYWDGVKWAGEPSPMTPPVSGGGFSVWKGITIVAVGILAALATVFVIVRITQPSDVECASQRADYALDNIELYEVDDACLD